MNIFKTKGKVESSNNEIELSSKKAELKQLISEKSSMVKKRSYYQKKYEEQKAIVEGLERQLELNFDDNKADKLSSEKENLEMYKKEYSKVYYDRYRFELEMTGLVTKHLSDEILNDKELLNKEKEILDLENKLTKAMQEHSNYYRDLINQKNDFVKEHLGGKDLGIHDFFKYFTPRDKIDKSRSDLFNRIQRGKNVKAYNENQASFENAARIR